VIFCEADKIDERLIQFPKQRTAELPTPGRPMSQDPSRESHRHPVRPLSNVSKNQFIGIIRQHNGNVKRIAATLGISRQSMYYNLRRFKIDVSEYRKRRRR
jgi:DNA-binding NtrC family response regulator